MLSNHPSPLTSVMDYACKKLLKTSITIKVLLGQRMSATRPLVQARIKDNGLSYGFNWISPTSSFWLPILFLFYSPPFFLCSQSGLITDGQSYFSPNNAVGTVQVR